VRLAARHIIMADEQLEIVSRRSEEEDAYAMKSPKWCSGNAHGQCQALWEVREVHNQSVGDISVPKISRFSMKEVKIQP